MQGTDTSGNKLNSEVLVTVAGQNKPGRVTFSLTDLTVPVTGLPITIGRTYDSLLKGQSGVYGTLSAQGCGLLATSGGQYFCFPGTPYQPTGYTYTDPIQL